MEVSWLKTRNARIPHVIAKQRKEATSALLIAKALVSRPTFTVLVVIRNVRQGLPNSEVYLSGPAILAEYDFQAFAAEEAKASSCV